MLKKLHFYIGTIFLVIFLITGLYLKHFLHSMPEDAPRLLLRSGHVYLFFASFINVMFGLYWPEPAKLKWTTIVNQGLVLVSPILLTYSFIFETALTYNIDRHVGAVGVILVFIWLGTTLIGKAWSALTRKELS